MNPFDNRIVTEPRRLEGTVASINQEALERVLAAFRQVAGRQGETTPSILLVTSPEPGFGKSHLIGRIFQALQNRASLIYIRAFQDPNTCWYNVVDKLIAELDLPDRADAVACRPGELTQLESLCRILFSSLFRRAVEFGPLRSDALLRFVPKFRQNPVSIFNDPGIRAGFTQNFDVFLPGLAGELRKQNIILRNSGRSWLAVLFHYALADASGDERQLCLDWLRGLPLDARENARIGVRAADAVAPELPPSERDEVCFRRLTDLCLLTSGYRPFLFCFDQTELYNRSPQLAHAFGAVLSRLRRELTNHLTVVTANQDVWERSIYPHFERADQDVIDPAPIRLSGVRKEQARELAVSRARLFSVDEQEITRFLAGRWFDKMFAARAERSARSILQECALHWGSPSLPAVDELFQRYLAEAVAKGAQRLKYDESVFRWFFEKALSKIQGLEVTAFNSTKGYLTLCWKTGTNVFLFCFEPGNNYLRWNSIADEAKDYWQRGRAKNLRVKTIGFRLPQHPEFGSKTHREVLAPAAPVLAILRPPQELITRIVAAYELYSEVAQGNHSHVSEDEVLSFLAAHFESDVKAWLASAAEAAVPEPVAEPAAPSDDRVAFIRERVQTLGSISWQVLKNDLQKAGLETDLPTALACCAALKSEVKVFTSPNTAFFQWISANSA